MPGLLGSILIVEASIFESNAVRVPEDGRTTDVTVLLATGKSGVGALIQGTDFFVPIWRIDDGPVYGIPWELCEEARQISDTQVSMGFPPSWPDLTCANVTHYGPDASYSQTVPLTEGAHTLWTGILAKSSVEPWGWMQGYIEVLSFLGPLFPNPPDPCVLRTLACSLRLP